MAIPTPDVIITGELMTLFGPAQVNPVVQPEFGSIDVALCGYGSFTPQIQGAKISLITQSQAMLPATDPNPGRFEIILYSNALIYPSGTYYTFTIKDANGDIVQCQSYVLSNGQYDLTQLTPFDPSQGPAPVQPLITNQLQVLVTIGVGDLFDGANFTAFQLNMTMDDTTNIDNAEAGNLYTFIIMQDSAGGHVLNWQSNMMNPPVINPAPNGVTVQTFVAVPDSGAMYGMLFYPISAPTWYVP